MMRQVGKPDGTHKVRRTMTDRLSNLPWDVLEKILVKLPLNEAVRTSALSSEWRYNWTRLSQFGLCNDCCPSYISDRESRWQWIMGIMDQIKTNHNGRIKKFELEACFWPDRADLDWLLMFLSEKGVKEFRLKDISFSKPFMRSSCLFYCQQLSQAHSEPRGFITMSDIPSTFKGLSCLKSLQLSLIFMKTETLEMLIGSCPLLETFILRILSGLKVLRIDNPKLKYLKIFTKFDDIIFGNSQFVVDVNIYKDPSLESLASRELEQRSISNTIRVLGNLCGVRRLTLNGSFLKFLAGYKTPQKLPSTINNLEFLKLHEVKFESYKQFRAIVCILNSSPNLTDLLITVDRRYRYHILSSWKEGLADWYGDDLHFDRLRLVKISGVFQLRTEKEFVDLILAHSPALERIEVVSLDDKLFPLSELREGDWASEHFEIMRADEHMQDPCDCGDDCFLH